MMSSDTRSIRHLSLIVLLLTTFFSSASWAVPIPDQSVDATVATGTRKISGFIYGAISSNPLDRAQIFTVGVGGVLTDIEVMVGRLNSVSNPLLWELLDVSSTGQPGTNILASGGVAASSFPGLGTGIFPSTFPSALISLGGLSVNVDLGDVLAIVLRTAESTFAAYSWRSTDIPYAGGSQFTRRASSDPWIPATSQNDPIYAGFRTFVDPMASVVPEPTTLALMGLGLAGIGYRLRRIKSA